MEDNTTNPFNTSQEPSDNESEKSSTSQDGRETAEANADPIPSSSFSTGKAPTYSWTPVNERLSVGFLEYYLIII